MPTRGRPKKVTPPQPSDTTVQADAQSSTDAPVVGSGAAKTRSNKREKKLNKPTRRSERIAKQNHETLISEIQSLSLLPAEAGNSNAETRPTVLNKAWTASEEQLKLINDSITSKHYYNYK